MSILYVSYAAITARYKEQRKGARKERQCHHAALIMQTVDTSERPWLDYLLDLTKIFWPKDGLQHDSGR